MNRSIILSLLLAAIAAPHEAAAQAKSDAAAKFYLDYNVPESPAFTALDLTPSNVLRGSSSKPVVVNLLSQIARGEKVPAGVAIDAAPYAYWGRFKNLSEYQKSAPKRFLANLLLSLATVQAPGDTNSVAFAGGVRATIHDDQDLLRDTALAREVGTLIAPTRIVCEMHPGTNICKPGVRVDTIERDVSQAYKAARERVGDRKGWAASLGGAIGGVLLQGIPSSDSLQQRTGRAWIAGSGYLGGGNEVLLTVQWVRDTSKKEHLRTGAAYRMQSANTSLAAELAYDDQAGGLLPGLNAEVRVLQRVTLVAALITDPPTDERAKKRIRFRTNLRWSASEGL